MNDMKLVVRTFTAGLFWHTEKNEEEKAGAECLVPPRSHQTYRDWLFMDSGISHGPQSSLAIGKKAIKKSLSAPQLPSSMSATSLQGHCHRRRSLARLEIILRQSGRLVLRPPPPHHSLTHLTPMGTQRGESSATAVFVRCSK